MIINPFIEFLRRFVGSPTPPPEPAYCVGSYTQHWFKHGATCLRCGKPNQRYKAPEPRDLLAEAREEAAAHESA